MDDKKRIPAIRFKGFTDSWEQRKLVEVVQITMGQSPDGETYSETSGDYILIQGNADLQNGWVVPRIWTSQITKKADAGDLIMSVRAPAGAMGKTAFDAVIGRGVAAIKGNEYIFQLLSKMDTTEYWKTFSCGSTFESLNSNNIKNAEVLIPDVHEQNQIGKLLKNLDSIITLHQRKLESLKKMKKALLEKMFPRDGENMPSIRFKGFTDSWEQRKVGDYYEFKNGLNKGKEYFGEGTPIVNFTDVFHNRGISPKMLSGRVRLEPFEIKNFEVGKGDIFFTRTSETIEEIGYPSVMLGEPKNTVFSGFVLRGRCFLNVDPLNDLFKKYLFFTDTFRTEMVRKSSMTTRALTSGTAIRNMKFLHPSSKEEQHRIGEFLTNLDNLITLHQRKLEKLKNIKKAMLEKMFV